DPQKVVDALVAEAKEKLAARVQAGDMTQAEADEKAANLAERIGNQVNRTPPRPPRPPRSPAP
ncbi:MAG: hypothetical protein M3394_09475, partial [Actinomycetota bacterium]|nr:hypothetical protein [Actinomycetota bacterium]